MNIDWNSIYKTLLLVGGIFLMIFGLMYLPQALREKREKSMDKRAYAKITKVEKVRTSSRTGNISLQSVVISYRFIAGFHIEEGIDNVQYNGYDNVMFLDSLLRSDQDSVLVEYLSKEPGKNQVYVPNRG